MKDMLYALLGLVSAALAAFFFYSFQKQAVDAGSMNLILAIVFVILAVVFGALFMFSRVTHHDEIHVTE